MVHSVDVDFVLFIECTRGSNCLDAFLYFVEHRGRPQHSDIHSRRHHSRSTHCKDRGDCPLHSLTPESRIKPQLPQDQASHRAAPFLSPVPALSNCAGSFPTFFRKVAAENADTVPSKEGGAANLWSCGKNARTQSLKTKSSLPDSDHTITSRSFCGQVFDDSSI